MDKNTEKTFTKPITLKKPINSCNFLSFDQIYLLHKDLHQNISDRKSTLFLSMFYDIKYVQLFETRKSLLIAFEEKQIPQNDSPMFTKDHTNNFQTAIQSKQLINMFQQLRSINETRKAKGISLKPVMQKYYQEIQNKVKVQKLCQQLEDRPNVICLLSINQKKDIQVLSKMIYSHKFYELIGKDIVQEAVKISQKKAIQTYSTNYNQQTEMIKMLEWGIKKMQEFIKNKIQDQRTLIYEIEKELKLNNGNLLKVQVQAFYVNPLVYYLVYTPHDCSLVSEKCKQKQKPSQVVVSKQMGYFSLQSLTFFDPSEKDHVAGYRHTTGTDQTIEIISKVHKN